MAVPDGQSSAFLAVVLDRGDGATLTHQLYVQLCDIILSGRLGDGARMPSTRRLCLNLQVSRTVTIQSRPALAATSVHEIGGDVVPAFAAGGATSSFDVAPDGRILVAEPVTGSYTLVLVRNWMAALLAR